MIDTIRQMRRITSQTLADVLAGIIDDQPSETAIRDAWHQRIATTSGIATEGWYQPPPQGIIVAIGNPPNYKRLEQPTYRSELAWPNPQYRMGPESLLFAYASPAHRATGLIGDLACSLYRGSDDALRTHLRNVWKITMQITQAAATGMTIAELYEQAGKLIVAGGFENNIYSVNDDASTNIGHTLPWSNEPMSRTEQYVIEHGTAGEQADLISHKRRFVSPKEMLKISGDLALTIEPRLNRPGLPTVGFHVVVAFEGREKVVITEFDSLFKLFGMKNLAHA